MALKNLKNLINEKAAWDARAAEEARRAYEEKERAHLEYKSEQLPAFQCLQQLESYFWECVNDFSRLTGLKIYHTSREKGWWGRTKSTLTIDNPRLYARFDGFKDDSWDHMTVSLEVIMRQGLQFHGDYGRSGKRITGGGYVEGKTYVNVRKNLSVESFEIQSACRWLETGFEDYYKKLNGM